MLQWHILVFVSPITASHMVLYHLCLPIISRVFWICRLKGSQLYGVAECCQLLIKFYKSFLLVFTWQIFDPKLFQIFIFLDKNYKSGFVLTEKIIKQAEGNFRFIVSGYICSSIGLWDSIHLSIKKSKTIKIMCSDIIILETKYKCVLFHYFLSQGKSFSMRILLLGGKT